MKATSVTLESHLRRARAIAVALASVTSIALVAGCGSAAGTSSDPSDGDQSLVVSEVIRSVFYAPLYVAAGNGAFKDHGLNVTIETANGGDKVTAALLSGQADVGLLGPETAVFLQNQNSAKKVKVFHQLTQRDGSFLVGRTPEANFELSAMDGQTIIGWREGSMPQMVIKSLMDSEGVKPKEYVSSIQAPAMAGAFTSGQGDVIQVFEPVATTLVDTAGAHVLASVGQLADPFPYTAFAALDSTVTSDSKTLSEFSGAISDAIDFVETKPAAEVAEAMKSFFPDTDVTVLAAAVERYREAEVWADQPVVEPAQFERLQDIMIHGGVLEEAQRVAYGDVVVDLSTPGMTS